MFISRKEFEDLKESVSNTRERINNLRKEIAEKQVLVSDSLLALLKSVHGDDARFITDYKGFGDSTIKIEKIEPSKRTQIYPEVKSILADNDALNNAIPCGKK